MGLRKNSNSKRNQKDVIFIETKIQVSYVHASTTMRQRLKIITKHNDALLMCFIM
jgi:hypothetical protein